MNTLPTLQCLNADTLELGRTSTLLHRLISETKRQLVVNFVTAVYTLNRKNVQVDCGHIIVVLQPLINVAEAGTFIEIELRLESLSPAKAKSRELQETDAFSENLSATRLCNMRTEVITVSFLVDTTGELFWKAAWLG